MYVLELDSMHASLDGSDLRCTLPSYTRIHKCADQRACRKAGLIHKLLGELPNKKLRQRAACTLTL